MKLYMCKHKRDIKFRWYLTYPCHMSKESRCKLKVTNPVVLDSVKTRGHDDQLGFEVLRRPNDFVFHFIIFF